MSVLIVCYKTEVFSELLEQGFTHPVVGRYLDGGTFGLIEDRVPGVEGINALLEYTNHRIEKETKSPLIWLSEIEAYDFTKEMGLCIMRDVLPLTEFPSYEEEISTLLSNNVIYSFIILDSQKQERSLWGLYGYSLPCMGPLRSVTSKDIVATWIRLSGSMFKSGRFLLEEENSEYSSVFEDQLTDRLKQLYGE